MLAGLAIAACAPRGVGSSWPVQSYANVCSHTVIMPFPPICLDEYNTGRGFQYPGEFDACRLSVENFIHALDRWRQCRVQEITEIALMISRQTTETISCLEAFGRSESSSPFYCQPVQIKFSDHGIYERELTNAPLCVRGQRFMPQGAESRWRISLCQDEVDRYLEQLSQAIDELDRRLRRETEEAAEKAVRIFNCMANRDEFCW